MNNPNFFLLMITGVAILAAVIISLRVRRRTRLSQMPEFNEVEDLLDPTMEEDIIVTHTSSQSFTATDNSKAAQKTLSELGFGHIDNMFENHVHHKRTESTITTQYNEFQNNNHKQNNMDIIVIHILAMPGQQFIGYELLQALLAAGMRYGEMSIFHRYQQQNGTGKILFSLSSATEPGSFDLNRMGAFACKGLSLFMQMRGSEHNLAAFENMLKVAYLLAEDLNGAVYDYQRKELSDEMINFYRQQVKRFQLSLKISESHRITV